MKPKKANIPIIILVIGTITVCIVALIAFKYIRDDRSAKINTFKYLEILNNVQNDLEYYKGDFNVLSEIYPKLRWEGGNLLTNYHYVVDQLNIEGNYLVFKKNNIFELKVQIE